VSQWMIAWHPQVERRMISAETANRRVNTGIRQ